ncbi:nucleotidyltransferase family protein [Plantibacter sp. YIM 135249]|jgi:predicted nucleotidyltransferase|uniref:nucleotidyltransferase family protein n=1 Tax=Plantibacter sp. YIM 135249 TaxID=3423918 RepID=UPI003D326C1F
MTTAVDIERESIASLCRAYGVSRLLVFGSAVSARFDPVRSDIDFFVDFGPEVTDRFDAYFGLQEDLEALLGRRVDLVMAGAVTNPFFAQSALASAEELYAA